MSANYYGGVCTFCHTPHRAVQTRLLWNHTLSQNTFEWDVTTTTGGTPFPTITCRGRGRRSSASAAMTATWPSVMSRGSAPRNGPAAAINSTNHNGDIYQIATHGQHGQQPPGCAPFPLNGTPAPTTARRQAPPPSSLAGRPIRRPWDSPLRADGNNVSPERLWARPASSARRVTTHTTARVQDVFFLRGSIDGTQAIGTSPEVPQEVAQ